METNAGSLITGTLILGALVLKLSDLVKYTINAVSRSGQSRSEGINGLVTLVLVAAGGVGVVYLMAQTQWAGEIKVGSLTLDKLGAGSLAVLGLTISSFGSLLYDVKKALDNKDSASTPRVTDAAEARRLEEGG